LSAMYGMCKYRHIGHMAHLLRCASKGRDYTSRLRRGARPAADASRKRPRCGEDGSAARPERRPESGPRGEVRPPPQVQGTVPTGAPACVERHIFYNACEKAGTP
jgi:hypothetical protein